MLQEFIAFAAYLALFRRDRFWHWLYLPLARGVEKLTALITVLQRGRISVYLMYSFATLLLLLFFVR